MSILVIATVCLFSGLFGFSIGREHGYMKRHQEAVDDWMRWHMAIRAHDYAEKK